MGSVDYLRQGGLFFFRRQRFYYLVIRRAFILSLKTAVIDQRGRYFLAIEYRHQFPQTQGRITPVEVCHDLRGAFHKTRKRLADNKRAVLGNHLEPKTGLDMVRQDAVFLHRLDMAGAEADQFGGIERLITR